MPGTNTLARSMHDVGLASWFGGSLMGAVGLNGAAASASDATERSEIATTGWKRWAPVSTASIITHLVGGAGVSRGNKHRIVGQKHVATWTLAKTALTAAAIGATAASGALGAKLAKEGGDHPTAGATEPSSSTPSEAASAQRGLKALQWATPALTGTLMLMTSRMGEQQRPGAVAAGVAKQLLPTS